MLTYLLTYITLSKMYQSPSHQHILSFSCNEINWYGTGTGTGKLT